jgi:(1->4)-alpha-D-glucan 1-alpha-D-glucosylmutase
VEDTALYVYAPLASRNEVGGDPGVPVEGAVERLHELLSRRYPRALNATNTHDTKRSADVRSRLDALSENSAVWGRRLAHWRRHHRGLRSLVRGKLAPTRTTDHFIYQALVGIWPIGAAPSRDGDRDDDDRRLGELRNRLTTYIQKAVREAKVSTSWTDPDAEYEEAISRFIAGLLDRRASGGGDFLRELEQFAEGLAPQAVWNALSRVVIHLTAPGVPDVYRGDELWFQALVDPDNRSPVDWAIRDDALGELRALAPGGEPADPAQLRAWLEAPSDGRLKMYLFEQLLRLRREHPSMTPAAAYTPLKVEGERMNGVFAFQRGEGRERALVVVPRLTCALGGGVPIGSIWGNTRVRLEDGAASSLAFRCALSGVILNATDGELLLADAMARLPAAVLIPHPGG